MRRSAFFALLVLGGGPLAPLVAHVDPRVSAWPHWLGPNQSGAVEDPGAFSGKASLRLEKAWSYPLDTGQAGLAVAEERVFTLFRDDSFDWAIALRADTGALAWRMKLDPGVESAFLVGPPSTPAFDAGSLYTLSSACRLRGHEAASGRVLWEIDLKVRFGVAFPAGCASSPFVEGGRLYVQVGGREDHRVAAFDPKTGDVLWTAKGAEPTVNASPVAASLGGVRQILVHHAAEGRSGVTGFRLADGALLWSLTLGDAFSFDSPMAVGADAVILSTVNDTQLLRVVRQGQGEGWTATAGWRTPDLQAGISPAVAYAGHLYGFGGDHLVSIDAASGKTNWKERIYPGSLIVVDGHLVVLSATAGLMRIVEATASGYREKGRLEVLNRGAQAWAPPAYAGRRVFVRNEEQIVAIDVR